VQPTHHPPLAGRYRTEGLWRGETLWAAFSRTAAWADTKTAIVEGGVASFASLVVEAERIAGGLVALGIRSADVVAFQLPNWREAMRS
jgi:2,3-dihydroxybenzoate-AMP ligase